MNNFMGQTSFHYASQNTPSGPMLYHSQTNGYTVRTNGVVGVPVAAQFFASNFPLPHLPSSCNVNIPDPVVRSGRKRSHDSLYDSDVKKSRCQDRDEVGGAFTFQGAFSWSDGNGTPVSRPATSFGTPVTPPVVSSSAEFPFSNSYVEHQTMINTECHYNRSLVEEMILEVHGS